MIRNMRIRKDKTATSGKLFKIDLGDDAYDTIKELEAQGVAEDCLLYGYNVYLQKSIGEAGGKDTGRDWTLVKAHLDKIGIPYTVEDYTVGEKVEDERLTLVKGLSREDLMEAIAAIKAKRLG